ncbi:MAG: hypothetical protein KIH63_003350 [Candidatus Saccharibacteria bacterium]|nr:hypothetical protein [Candidatus Saccharibacteria bacterium]
MPKTLEDIIASYQPGPEGVDLVKNTPILLVVGVSGAGKDTIKAKLLETDKYHNVVSHTTRLPRSNQGVMEQDGVEYHFVSLETAELMLRNKGFVEAKYYSGNVYGTSVGEIRLAHDEGKVAINDVEVKGVAEFKAISSNVVAVFVLPPSFAIWQQRISSRSGDNTLENIDKRLATARVEIEHAVDVGYFHFVINDDLGATVQEVDDIAHGKLQKSQENKALDLARSLLEDLDKTIG